MKNLLCVKSIMTIMITAMLCVMVYLQPDTYEEVFKNIAIMVATWYFSYQSRKVASSDVGNSDVLSGSSANIPVRVREEDKNSD